jgi:hypothetical protein
MHVEPCTLQRSALQTPSGLCFIPFSCWSVGLDESHSTAIFQRDSASCQPATALHPLSSRSRQVNTPSRCTPSQSRSEAPNDLSHANAYHPDSPQPHPSLPHPEALHHITFAPPYLPSATIIAETLLASPTAMAERDGYGSASQPASPRLSRRPHPMRRQNSTNDDERAPLLLNTSRSRIRIHGGAASPGRPNLSRDQSYSGMEYVMKIPLFA